MNQLLQELMAKVANLQGEVTALQRRQPAEPQTRKRFRNSHSIDATAPGSLRDGVDDPEGVRSDPGSEEEDTMEDDGTSFSMSEEREAF